jgi:IS30 family transposase
MIPPAQRAEIRRLFYAEHWPVGTIATTLGVHHDTVQGRVVRRRVDENGRGIYFWSTGFQLGQFPV